MDARVAFQQAVINRLWDVAEAELGLLTLTKEDVPDFGFHNPIDAVFAVWFGMKDQHLPEPGGMLDQPADLIADVQLLNYIYSIVKHIVSDEKANHAPKAQPGNWSDTVRDRDGQIVGTYMGNMFDGT